MSLFEAGFNLPPGCSPGDPRAPWNQDFPPGVEDVMGEVVMWPEGPDEDTLVPEFGEVTDYEDVEPDYERNEDGGVTASGGGVRFEVTKLFANRREVAWVGDLTVVPDGLKDVVEKHLEAGRFEARAQGLRNAAANKRAQAGREAVQARSQS
jgi:hypothetical protein